MRNELIDSDERWGEVIEDLDNDSICVVNRLISGGKALALRVFLENKLP